MRLSNEPRTAVVSEGNISVVFTVGEIYLVNLIGSGSM